MKISYTNDAFQSLLGLVNFIESKNTKGAGSRWLKKYEIFIKEKFMYHNHISFCKNITFQKLNLKCINYNDWIIAFSTSENTILIEALLHKSRISD